MKMRELIVSPYGRRLRIFVGDQQSYINYIKKHYEIKRELPEKDGEYCYYLNEEDKQKSFHAIWVCDLSYNYELQALLAHECMHCVFSILRNAGVEFTDGGEEAYTYLLGYLVEEINVRFLGKGKAS